MPSRSALLAVAAAALLGLASHAAAQVAPLDCATLPSNWYQEQEDNNGPWSTLADGGASSSMLSTVYSTLQQRVSQGELSAPGWTFCSSPTSAAAGCTQASLVATGFLSVLKRRVCDGSVGGGGSCMPAGALPALEPANIGHSLAVAMITCCCSRPDGAQTMLFRWVPGS